MSRDLFWPTTGADFGTLSNGRLRMLRGHTVAEVRARIDAAEPTDVVAHCCCGGTWTAERLSDYLDTASEAYTDVEIAGHLRRLGWM